MLGLRNDSTVHAKLLKHVMNGANISYFVIDDSDHSDALYTGRPMVNLRLMNRRFVSDSDVSPSLGYSEIPHRTGAM